MASGMAATLVGARRETVLPDARVIEHWNVEAVSCPSSVRASELMTPELVTVVPAGSNSRNLSTMRGYERKVRICRCWVSVADTASFNDDPALKNPWPSCIRIRHQAGWRRISTAPPAWLDSRALLVRLARRVLGSVANIVQGGTTVTALPPHWANIGHTRRRSEAMNTRGTHVPTDLSALPRAYQHRRWRQVGDARETDRQAERGAFPARSDPPPGAGSQTQQAAKSGVGNPEAPGVVKHQRRIACGALGVGGPSRMRLASGEPTDARLEMRGKRHRIRDTKRQRPCAVQFADCADAEPDRPEQGIIELGDARART